MSSSNKRIETGKKGEELAASHLIKLGYRLLEKNWRSRIGEIDLIAEDEDTLVFVEVRTRTGSFHFGTGFESVDWRKQNKLRLVANQYLHYYQLHNRECRFDVIAINLDSNQPIDHLIHAF